MKYYLHDSNAFNDEKISELFIQFGYEGLGLFYTILEKIAGQEKPIKTTVLKNQLKVGKRLEKCWLFMEEIGLISSNNGDTFNKQLLNYSESYKIKKEKNAERISKWREKQEVTENVTHSEQVRNASKVKVGKVKESKSNKELFSEDKTSDSIYPDCMALYDKFIRCHTNVEPKITGASGLALKRIISYISKIVKVKNNDKVEVPNTLEFIFNQYNLWDTYHKKQLKLEQIDSNLINILSSIKNTKNGQSTTTTKSQSTYSEAKSAFGA